MHRGFDSARTSPRRLAATALVLLWSFLAAGPSPAEAAPRAPAASGAKGALFLFVGQGEPAPVAGPASAGSRAGFAPVGADQSLGYRKDALWFRLELPREWRGGLVLLRSTYMDRIEAFVASEGEDPEAPAARSEFAYGFGGYSLDPGTRARSVSFRVATDASIKFRVSLADPGRPDEAERLALGIYLGAFLAFLGFALLLAISDADSPPAERIAFPLLIAAGILYAAASSGLGWEFLWKGSSYLEKRATPLCTCAVVFLSLALARSSLALKRRARPLDLLLAALQASAPLLAVALLAADFRAAMAVGGILVLASMGSLIAACAFGALKRWRQSYFLLPAFAAFALGSAAAQGITFGAFAAIQAAKPEFLGFALQALFILSGRRDAAGRLAESRLSAARLGRVVLAERTRQDSKAGFFSALFHELKNPLALAEASLKAVERGEYGKSVPADHRSFSLVRKNLHRLERLVDGALDAIEIEEGKRTARPEPVDLGAGFGLIASEFKSVLEAKGVRLKAAPPRGLYAAVDRRHFEIIAFNLLSNALRRAPEGSSVLASFGKAGGEATLEIADSGPRLDASMRESIFDLYRTAFDGSRAGNEDTFIGLCQARQLARLNGGELSLSESSAASETFRLALPLSARAPGALLESSEDERAAYRPERPSKEEPKPAAARGAREKAQAPPRRSPGDGAKRILVVEDAPDLLEFLAEALGKDFEVATAMNGAEALERLEAGHLPDLIVSDLMMPVMDGSALLERLKARDAFSSIPLIFLTARNQAEDRVKSFQDGAVAYIAKPFFYEELKAAVDNILDLREGALKDAESRVIDAIRSRRGARTKADPAARAAGIEETMAALGFTRQEREVAVLVATGKSDKEIASLLGLSSRTVSNYVGKLLKKADASSRTELSVRLNG